MKTSFAGKIPLGYIPIRKVGRRVHYIPKRNSFFYLVFLYMMLWVSSSNAQKIEYADSTIDPNDSSNILPFGYTFVSPQYVDYTEGWNIMGLTTDGVSPYNFYYYKLLQVNDNSDSYRSIIEVSVQGDDNHFQDQGVYRIEVTKYVGTSNRFDGLEIRCILGNPEVATFFIFNNALWVKSNYKWGELYYRAVGEFSNYTPKSPISGGDFNKTINPPAGYLISTNSFGLKCDFDNNIFYKLPYTDIYGNRVLYGNVGIGIKNPQSKLAVNGTVTAKQVKVTQTGWPDYVFYPSRPLPDLSKMETFIKANHHLPDVPSAKEIENKGLDLGDMQKKQMQKIEELTLLLIRQQHEIDSLKSIVMDKLLTAGKQKISNK